MSQSHSATRELILECAREEFLQKGYQAASLRSIVSKASVTTGALYGHFKNKEDLFDALVGEVYHHTFALYSDLLQQFFKLPPREQQEKMADYSARGMEQMSVYLYEHEEAFRLLLCCSEGTNYAHMVEDLARMDVQATHDFEDAVDSIGTDVQRVHPILEQVLTTNMFSSFFDLIVRDVPREEADAYIRQLLTFYAGGWMQVMGL